MYLHLKYELYNKVRRCSQDFYQCIKYNKKKLNLFFLLIAARNRLEIISDRPSQIACTVKTLHVTRTQTALHVHKSLCTILIPLCKSNLNLPIFFPFFSALCLVAFIMLSCLLPRCAAQIFCLFVFTDIDFVAHL